MTENETETRTLSFIALDKLVVFPGLSIDFELKESAELDRVTEAIQKSKELLIVKRREPAEPEDSHLSERIPNFHPEDSLVAPVGTVCRIRRILKLPNNRTRVHAEGKERVILGKVTNPDAKEVTVTPYPMQILPLSPVEGEAMKRLLIDYIRRFEQSAPKPGNALSESLSVITDLNELITKAGALLPAPSVFKQYLLQANTNLDAYRILCDIVQKEAAVSAIQRELQQKVQENIDRNQKEYVLREQLKVIHEELGDSAPADESERFREQVEKLQASEEVKECIRAEIRRLNTVGSNNSEGSVIRTYIETMLSLPWDKESVDNPDLTHAEAILERDHYGMEEVKERILQFLAVRSMTENLNSPILLLVGPPGTGKTSIAKSIAEALNRKYVRICLGGVRDEAEIRGHRRTYIASMPGRIVRGLIDAGTKNPLMLLDEVDKLGSDYKGDPSAALLEVLDSAQNERFIDHFIEQPVDLSHVIFLATANTTETIPRPLLDRMEVIELSSYTKKEKLHIAKEHLLPKELVQHGLAKKQLSVTDKAMEALIEHYTKEAGVRALERKLGEICRKACRNILLARENGEAEKPIRVSERNLTDYAGKPKFRRQEITKKPEIGVVHGLAWTSVGGVLMDLEVSLLPGKGEFILTGSLGDVMKESAGIGRSYLKSNAETLGIAKERFTDYDIHIHAPEGATPKDGPSAGITMVTAMYSALTETPVRQDIAMTGEVTLRGRVLPIGGLKEKLLAAAANGMKEVLIPEANRADYEELSEEVVGTLVPHFVTNVSEVLPLARA